MKTWVGYAVLLLVLTLLPLESLAQGADVGISGIALKAIQPPDDTFSGPQVDGDLGKYNQGFGVGLGLSVISPDGFVAAAEYTTARFEGQVAGRLINGGGADQGRSRKAELQDSLLVGLVGYAKSAGRTRVLFLGGGGVALNGESLDGVPRPFQEGLKLLITGGRYAWVDRKDSLLIGPHVFRIGAGMRVRIN